MQRPNFKTDRLSTDGAAEFLGVSRGTLEVWRCTGRYNLPYYKIGRRVFYLQSDLEAFITRRRVESTEAA